MFRKSTETLVPVLIACTALSGGCSSSSNTNGGGSGSGGGADAGASTGDSGSGPSNGNPSNGSPGSESGSTVAFPSGYAATAELSKEPVRSFTKADQVLDVSKDYVAVLETDLGSITLDLLAADTPMTCNSFVFLALHHFYDGVAFHRVIEGFMAQTGDPNSTSRNTSSWGQGGPGYSFGLEVKPSLNFDAEGVVGMARTDDPNSNGSQFFITFKATANLNQTYTVFAKVRTGGNLLRKNCARRTTICSDADRARMDWQQIALAIGSHNLSPPPRTGMAIPETKGAHRVRLRPPWRDRSRPDTNRPTMGERARAYFEKAGAVGGLRGKVRLAMLSKMTSTEAETLADSSEHLGRLEAALRTVQKEIAGAPKPSETTDALTGHSLAGPTGVGAAEMLRHHLRTFLDLMSQRSLFLGDQDTTFRRITETAATTLDLARTSIWLVDPGVTKITCADLFERDAGKHSSGLELFAKDFGPYFHALREEKTIAAHDAHTDPRTSCFSVGYLKPLGIQSMLDVPIWTNHEMVGVVCHEHIGPKRRTWTADDENFGYLMAGFAALAMERRAQV